MTKARTGQGSPTDGADAGRSARVGGLLDDLIEVEQRVQQAVGQAEAEAERAVAAVEAEMESHVRSHDDALDRSLAALRADIEAEGVERVTEIERWSEEAARRYRDVDDARVHALAEYVAQRVAEGEAES